MAVEIVDTPPNIENVNLRTLLDYWLGKVDGLTPPRRADIDPLQIPRLLPHIWIQERIPGSDDFRCRLAGEDVKSNYPTKVVGRIFREVIGDEAWALVREQYLLAIGTPGICHFRGPVYLHTIRRGGMGERLVMPLRNEDGENDFVIGATIYTPMSEKTLEEKRVPPRITFTPLKALTGNS